MTIPIDENIRIELIAPQHAVAIFDMVNSNRAYLREWLSFVDRMQSVDFADNFVQGSVQRQQAAIEWAFVIFYENEMVGRVGVYKIDAQNKIGEIGYWLIEKAQGQGIVTKTCRALLDFCFNEINLNRVEIKCGSGNTKSQQIPRFLNFRHEGVIRQGEWLYDRFIDLELFSLLREEFEVRNI